MVLLVIFWIVHRFYVIFGTMVDFIIFRLFYFYVMYGLYVMFGNVWTDSIYVMADALDDLYVIFGTVD